MTRELSVSRPTSGPLDRSFDLYARMVRRALGTPIALVTRVEPTRQVFVGATGLPEDLEGDPQTPLSHSLCQYVVTDQSPLVVTDARLDHRLRDNGAVADLDVIAYAGWPLTDHTGAVVGSVCAIDHRPREWTAEELESLADLAAACSSELAQRELRDLAATSELHARDLMARSRVLLALSEQLAATHTVADVAAVVQRIATRHLGCVRTGMWVLEDVLTGHPTPVGQRRVIPSLTYVPTADDPASDSWGQGAAEVLLSLDDSNPLGEALLRGLPVYFSTRQEQDDRYPHLRQRTRLGESRAFLPLTTRGRDLGTLVLLWDDRRTLSGEERVTIAALTSYVTQALQRALLVQERLEALVVLQNSLLSHLPATGDLALAAHYRPAARHDQVGGDWYDAVLMPHGATAVMVGDVVGHDIRAAATMGQLRTMLRAFAYALDDPPSRNVERLDQAMHDLGVEGLATLLYVRIEQTDHLRAAGVRRLRWTSAGHPPALLVQPDGRVVWLGEDPDPMLGLWPGFPRSDHTVTAPEGATLLLYTDGLVERRGEDLQHGFDRLADAATRLRDLPVERFLHGILDELAGSALADDVAVLAVRFDSQP